jgi:acetyl-CoA C-acetyltransferase
MHSAVLLAARRTPLGKFIGNLNQVHPAALGAACSKAALADARIGMEGIQEVIFGSARQSGVGPNVARQVAVRAGVPVGVPAFTVNKACASGLKAIALAAQAVRAGEAELLLAGGAESMSRVPFLLDRGRDGYRLGHAEAVDGMYRDGFLCPLCGKLMGETAEDLAVRYAISREEQDAMAAESHRRWGVASREGRFAAEVAPVAVEDRMVTMDEHPREGVTVESLSRLPAVFRPGGSVSAGNSSGIADGAAAVVVSSEDRAKELGLDPIARIAGWASAGVEPAEMGLGPIPALRALERKLGWGHREADLIELNEAFAAQVIACEREVRLDRSRMNVNGGAIALGHPVGATGARLVVTLVHEMKRRSARRGIAALCVSGGLGLAMALERP